MTTLLLRRRCSSAAAKAALKASLNLPRTDFPLHPKAAATEPRLAPRLARDHYVRQAVLRAESRNFVLHDGPPYANGELHMGHFLNKSLKDMINRWQLLRGRRIQYTPGWDCHGLPIEMRALQLAGVEVAHALPPLQIRAQAAASAREAVEAQRASFMRWGIMADWDAPYTTMQPTYEAAQLDVFGAMLRRGLIFRGARPVHWSPASRTALAEAEIDYVDDHVSTAVHVAFPLVPSQRLPAPFESALAAVLAPSSSPAAPSEGVDATARPAVVVWTTTPWTLPANQAICARHDLQYALVEVGPPGATDDAIDSSSSSNTASPADESRAASADASSSTGVTSSSRLPSLLLLAEARVDAVSEAIGRPLRVLATTGGEALEGLECTHPLSDRTVPLLLADHVTDTAGTGLVHTAPGHGPEDFAVGRAHGLEPTCPVDESGRFTCQTEEARRFAGLAVLSDGTSAVVEAVADRGLLLSSTPYYHRYPYDWRSKTPVIFRTTPQWFADLSQLREPALAALANVEMLPSSGRARLEAFVKGRGEWCISRQRSWGVPLPAFYHRVTGEALLTPETVEHARRLVESRGTDCWWELSEDELLPPRLAGSASEWAKGTDTLDVWFDSGTSWRAVLGGEDEQAGGAAARGEVSGGQGDGGGSRIEPTSPPADLYLEGSDQHRGWFQSSLLTHVGASERGGAPYGSIITHGFVVDERGNKMSKSVGNVIMPRDLIHGTAATVSPASSKLDASAEAGRDSGGGASKGGGKGGGKGSGKGSKQQRKAAHAAKQKHGAKSMYSVDMLRIWVATSDWKGDVAIGETVLERSRESYRRLRNTFRFILGNLADFDAQKDAVAHHSLRLNDQYMLHRLGEFASLVQTAHDAHALNRVMSLSLSLASEELSASYFDACKDRLYCAQSDGVSRRAVQTVLSEALHTLTLSVAPIVPFLVEEVHEQLPEPRPPPPFERTWTPPPASWHQPKLARSWSLALSVKEEVTRAIHAAVLDKRLKGGAQALVELCVEPEAELYLALDSLGSELNDLFGVCATRLLACSSSDAADGEAGRAAHTDALESDAAQGDVVGHFHGVIEAARSEVRIAIRVSEAPKCERCWRHVPEGASWYADEGAGEEGIELADGWLYRGCACNT